MTSECANRGSPLLLASRRDGRGASLSKPRPVGSTISLFQSPFNSCSRMCSISSSNSNYGFRFSQLPLNVISSKIAVLLAIAATVFVSDVLSSSDVFSNSFLVRFRRNVEQQEAHEIASMHGFVNLGPVSLPKIVLTH